MKPTIMKTPLFLAAALVPLAGSTALAQDRTGPIDTLPQGRYECALPGDAGGKAWRHQPDRDFTIGNSSSYRTKAGKGTYLLRGKALTFTRGPMKGQSFLRVGTDTLRNRKANGSPGDLRCVRVR